MWHTILWTACQYSPSELWLLLCPSSMDNIQFRRIARGGCVVCLPGVSIFLMHFTVEENSMACWDGVRVDVALFNNRKVPLFSFSSNFTFLASAAITLLPVLYAFYVRAMTDNVYPARAADILDSPVSLGDAVATAERTRTPGTYIGQPKTLESVSSFSLAHFMMILSQCRSLRFCRRRFC
jgi:hypothetical protein